LSHGQLVIEDVSFHRATNTGIEGGSPDSGGAVFAFLRNTGTTTESFTQAAIKVNGQAASSFASLDWSRVWPPSIDPGGVATLTLKGANNPFKEGASLSLEVTTNAGTTVSAVSQLTTPNLRIGNVIPAQDRRSSYVFLRNLDPVHSFHVDQLFLNDDVTGTSDFVGGSRVIGPQSVQIVKVDHGTALPLLTPLAARVKATRSADGLPVAVGAPIRLTEPILPSGSYSSNLSNDEAVMEDVRLNYGHTMSWMYCECGSAASNYSKYGLRGFNNGRLDFLSTGSNQWDVNTVYDRESGQTAPVFTLPPAVQQAANNAGYYAWYLADEPDLRIGQANRNPQAMWRLNETFWRNSNKPTYVNLASDKTVQRYGLISDHASFDHYMQFAPLVYNAGTYPIDEALQYAESIKNNVEPLRVWSITQGVSPTTWSKQPTDWGVAVQFWSAVMGGAKGVVGFKFDAGDTMRSQYPTQLQRQIDLTHELQMVRGLVLYGEPINNVQTSVAATDMAARSLISERGVVVPVVNLTGRYSTGFFGVGSSVSFDTLNNVSVRVPIPDWIAIEQVKEVTPAGFVDVNYTRNGQEVTIPLATLRDSRVFVISERDSRPPDAVTQFQRTQRTGGSTPAPPNTAFLSWREPFDDFGIQGYKLYQQEIEVADVVAPAYRLAFETGAPLVPYAVRAYDAAGNLGSVSNAVLLPKTVFLTGDYNGNGAVDGPDLLLWQSTYGRTGGNLLADGNRNNAVDDGDYALWSSGFGNRLAPASAAGRANEVPEPGVGCLALVGLAIARWRRNKIASETQPPAARTTSPAVFSDVRSGVTGAFAARRQHWRLRGS
jgi:flavin-binding protein dodecin